MARGRRITSDTRQPQARLAFAAGPGAQDPKTQIEAGRVLDQWLSGPDAGGLLHELRGSAELRSVLPELAVCDGFDQRSPYHPEGDLYTHIAGVLERVSALSDDPDLRWAAVLHDIGKPDSFWLDEEGVGHFYASEEHGTEHHEEISARMAEPILERLGIPPARRERIVHLVRHHMFAAFESPRSARRFLARVGDEHADALLLHRHADWEGDGDPALAVARMRELLGRARDFTPPTPPLSIGGGLLVSELGMTPGPAVGELLAALQAEVESGSLADEPQELLRRARELAAGR